METLDRPVEATIRAYYEMAVPFIAAAIGSVPFTTTFFADGAMTRGRASEPPLPEGARTLVVPLRGAPAPYLLFGKTEAELCLSRHGAGFESWTPTEADPLRARLAHILLRPIGRATETMLRRAARTMREALEDDGIQATPVLDGIGITLWIPLAGGPDYANVRGWLHAVVARAMEKEIELFSTRPLAESNGRIHVWVSSNAPGQGCNLPYSLHVGERLRVLTPIAWDELETFANGDFLAENFGFRLDDVGDRFAESLAAIGDQRLPAAKPRTESLALAPAAGNRILDVAIEILWDGKPRTAEEILAEAIARDLLTKSTPPLYIYGALKRYIELTIARGGKPKVVREHGNIFRANHAADDWPDIIAPPAPDIEPLLKRLESTMHRDPEGFEESVFAVFSALGFKSTHIGGPHRPDGYIDAPLGPAAYRVMIECKTAGKDAIDMPDAWEAAEHKDEYHADFAMLIGPAIKDNQRTIDEAKAHGVSIWLVEDLETISRRRIDLWSMRTLFEPGMVGDKLEDLLWELDHGAASRIKKLCAIIASEGWQTQLDAVGAAGDPPRLTVEAAMFLVDARLHAAGSQTAATRSEVAAAFEHLCDPLVGMARRLDGVDGAIVIVRAFG